MSDELHEPSYEEGSRAAWRTMLGLALRHLDVEGDPQVELAHLAKEREDTAAQLRGLCRRLGVEWPDGLYLADVVEKYIAPEVERLRSRLQDANATGAAMHESLRAEIDLAIRAYVRDRDDEKRRALQRWLRDAAAALHEKRERDATSPDKGSPATAQSSALDLKKLLIEPLLALQERVHLETGTAPAVEMVVHSALYDELIGQLSAGPMHGAGIDQRPGVEAVFFGRDLVIVPQRAKHRAAPAGAPLTEAELAKLGESGDEPTARAAAEIRRLRAEIAEAAEHEKYALIHAVSMAASSTP